MPFVSELIGRPVADLDGEQIGLLKELLAADRRFFDDAAQEGQGRAYAAQLADHSRLHREGFPPFAHQNAIQSYLAAHPGFLSGEPLRSDVASSCDLGYHGNGKVGKGQ